MHLNPEDIKNVTELKIGEKLERRRRSISQVVVKANLEEETAGDNGRSGMNGEPGVEQQPRGPDESIGIFLPRIVPRTVHQADRAPPGRLFRRRSALRCPLPPLLGRKADRKEEKNGRENGRMMNGDEVRGAADEEEEDEGGDELEKREADEMVEKRKKRMMMMNNGMPDDEDGTVRPDEGGKVKQEEEKKEEEDKLMNCHRMAMEMVNELVDRLLCRREHRRMVNGGDQLEQGTEQPEDERQQLMMAELHKDFLPYVYAKAEREAVRYRLMLARGHCSADQPPLQESSFARKKFAEYGGWGLIRSDKSHHFNHRSID